jgi:hypothetical protein
MSCAQITTQVVLMQYGTNWFRLCAIYVKSFITHEMLSLKENSYGIEGNFISIKPDEINLESLMQIFGVELFRNMYHQAIQ